MATVSLCMIVKDEAKVLARCLDSVREAVDEIVIVDTGSTDGTKEIAAGYTDKIYDFAWVDDFSAARNFSFSKATMDYILWLDADDVLLPVDLDGFICLKNALDTRSADVVMMRYNTAFDEEDKPVFYFFRERLIRRRLPFVWKGCVHEYIAHTGTVEYSDVAVTHRSVKTTYSDRNLRIYEKLSAQQLPLTPRDTFYFARELYYHRQYDRAIQMLQSYLDAGEGWLENNVEACKILSYCYRDTGRDKQALQALMRSFALDIPRADICCEVGNVFMRMGEYRIAAFWFEQALHLPHDAASGAFISEDCYGYLPCIQLCVCYDRLGDRALAAEYNRRAGEYRPHAKAYLQNLQYFNAKAMHTTDPF